MNLLRPFVALAVAGGFLCPVLSKADAPPFTPPKQFSADQVITTNNGMNISSHLAVDNGKARSEMTMQGTQVISIVRPDQQKMYSVMPSQKMVMVMPINPKMVEQLKAAQGDEGKFDAAGTDTVDGVACNKYKMTASSGKVYYWWIDASKKTPVKMAADDGSFTVTFKNYVMGPQQASLFEPPSDYQVMQMPAMGGGAAGGGADGGAAPAPGGGAGQ